MAPSVDLAGGLAVGDSLTNWSLGGWLQAPPALVFGRGRLCSPGPCRLTCRSKYFPYLMPVLSSCRTVCRMSLIHIGCRSSSSLCGALVPMSSGLSWLVGPVPAIWSWGDHLRIDLKHDRG